MSSKVQKQAPATLAPPSPSTGSTSLTTPPASPGVTSILAEDGRDGSPFSSPLKKRKMHERESLNRLNERLEWYVVAIKRNEERKAELEAELNLSMERHQTELKDMRVVYEQRLQDLRNLLNTEQQKVLDLERLKGKHDGTVAGLRKELEDKQDELSKAHALVSQLEAQLLQAKARISALQQDLDELREKASTVSVLESKLATLRLQLSKEFSDTEGELKAQLNEKLAVALSELKAQNKEELEIRKAEQQRIYNEKYALLRSKEELFEQLNQRLALENAELKKRLEKALADAADFELKWKQAVASEQKKDAELRLTQEDNARLLKAVSEREEEAARARERCRRVEQQLADMLAELRKADEKYLALQKEHAELLKGQAELKASKGQLQNQLDDLKVAKGKLENEVANLKVELENAKQDAKVDRLTKELIELRTKYVQKEAEFNDLMDEKVTLAAELEKYNILLEHLENSHTSKDKKEVSTLSISSTITTASSTTVVAASSSSSSSSTTSAASAAAAVQPGFVSSGNAEVMIEKLDLLRDCAVVGNRTNKDVDIGGWTLYSKRTNMKFKFPEPLVLKPGAVVNVWSGKNNEGKNAPPTDLFWTKRFVWNNSTSSAELYDKHNKLVHSLSQQAPSKEMDTA